MRSGVSRGALHPTDILPRVLRTGRQDAKLTAQNLQEGTETLRIWLMKIRGLVLVIKMSTIIHHDRCCCRRITLYDADIDNNNMNM